MVNDVIKVKNAVLRNLINKVEVVKVVLQI